MRKRSFDERIIVQYISDDTLRISVADATVAIDIKIGETNPWMNDESYGAWALTVWWSGRQRRLWQLIWRSLELSMNRTVTQRWQFDRWIVQWISDDSLGMSAAETTVRRPSVWCSLMHHCHGDRYEVGVPPCATATVVHLLLYSIILLYNMIMSYEKGRHLMQTLLSCGNVFFYALKFLHPAIPSEWLFNFLQIVETLMSLFRIGWKLKRRRCMKIMSQCPLLWPVSQGEDIHYLILIELCKQW